MKMYSTLFIILCSLILMSVKVQAQWHEQTSPTTSTLYSVSVVDDSVAWIGGTHGIVLRTTNGGNMWTMVGGGAIGTDDIYNIFGVDSSTALCTSSSASSTFIYKTTDGGTTWMQVYTQAGGFMDGIWMFDSTNGFAYGDPVAGFWELYKTSDAGSTWMPAGSLAQDGAEAGWNNALFVSDSNIFFGTNNSRIYYSGDMGNSWTIESTTQANSYSIWFNDTTTGLTGGSELNRTTDGGNSWTLLATLPDAGSLAGITGKDSLWWAARQTGKIFYSTDNGTTWDSQYVVSAGIYFAMARSREPRGGGLVLAVRNNGGISAYNIAGPTGVKNENVPVPLTFNLSQNYPNPFNPSTKIKYNIASAGNVKLTVYNVLGQEIAELVNGEVSAGLHEVTFNASSLPSGAYLYKLEQGSSVMVKKMLLLK